MEKVLAQMLLIFLGSSICFAQVISSSQGSVPPNRTEAERAIRVVLYEMSIANQSGDAKMFEKYAAQRTLKFYDLLADELLKNPTIGEPLKVAGVTNGESYIEFGFRSLAQRAAVKPRFEMVDFARKFAAVPLTFLSDTEANVENKAGVFRVVMEEGEWKVDGTDVLRKTLLVVLPLSAESKAKLEKI